MCVVLCREGTGAMASRMAMALLAWSMICGAAVQAYDDFDFFYFVQQVCVCMSYLSHWNSPCIELRVMLSSTKRLLENRAICFLGLVFTIFYC
jgi:hypothetical protein